MSRRTERLNLPLDTSEKERLRREAAEAKLSMTDYVREALGLPLVRKRRNGS